MALKTNKIFLTTALLCSVCAFSANAANVETNTAHMQAMDKITGKVSEIDVPVNSLVKFGSFSILVRKCITRTPEETPENTAFVDVVDDYNNQEPVNIFKGWMLSSSPALNAVEHPIYDVWLLKCYDKNNSGAKRLSEDELKARDEIKMVRPDQKPDKEESPAPQAENKETNPELDAMIKATIEDGVAVPSEEKSEKDEVKAEVVEVVVTTPEANAEGDSDAPQALIHIEQQAEQPGTDAAENTAAEEIEAESSEEISAPDETAEFDDENGFSDEEEPEE